MSQVIITIQDTIYSGVNSYGANEPSSWTQVFTAGAFAAVTVPAGAMGVLIIPPDVSTGTITLKGVTGDTGINIPQATISYHSLDPVLASFGLLCAGNATILFIFV